MGCYLTENWAKKEPRFRYMMLDRLRQDCEYYIRNDFETGSCLWAKDEKVQIENMKAIWRSFPDEDKPEWLTWEDILEFERRMVKK